MSDVYTKELLHELRAERIASYKRKAIENAVEHFKNVIVDAASNNDTTRLVETVGVILQHKKSYNYDLCDIFTFKNEIIQSLQTIFPDSIISYIVPTENKYNFTLCVDWT